jgi:hypothetical protein
MHLTGGTYELRCKRCYILARTWQVFAYVMAACLLIWLITVFLSGMGVGQSP